MRNSAIYRCPDDINNFKFRIKLKEIGNNNDKIGLGDSNDQDNDDCVVSFKWQEKKFGISEMEYYTNEKNCTTDLDKKYHRDVLLNETRSNLIYSYVHVDNFDFVEDKVVTSRKVSMLEEELYASQRRNVCCNRLDYVHDSLLSSTCNPSIGNDFESMFIVADFGEHYEGTWLKRERVLLILRYYKDKGILRCTPDFNRTYCIDETNGNDTKMFIYFIENTSETITTTTGLLLKENEILNKVKLHNLKLKARHLNDNSFVQSPKYKMNVHLFVEILNGKKFDDDPNDLYVQYYLDLPDMWTNVDNDNLQGSTQSCHKKMQNFNVNNDDDGSTNEGCTVFFGFPFEFNLQCNLQDLDENTKPTFPRIYFEVISKSSWNRSRIEGVTYCAIPIYRPGTYEMKLHCLRIRPKSLYGNLKRYFIGDYMSCNDVTWYGLPFIRDKVDIINKYGVDTIFNGELNIRMNVIHQSQAFLMDLNLNMDRKNRKETFLLEKLNSSGLIKSVEQVLMAFRDARKRMLEVRCKS